MVGLDRDPTLATKLANTAGQAASEIVGSCRPASWLAQSIGWLSSAIWTLRIVICRWIRRGEGNLHGAALARPQSAGRTAAADPQEPRTVVKVPLGVKARRPLVAIISNRGARASVLLWLTKLTVTSMPGFANRWETTVDFARWPTWLRPR